MNKFKKIVILNVLNLPSFANDQIRLYSESEVIFPDSDSQSEEESIKIIGDADAVLGSWDTTITSTILDACPKLKYIGICGTSMTKIDQEAVKERGIILKNITDYGDEAISEFIFAQLLCLLRGYQGHQWRDLSAELSGKKIGIIGLGAVGKTVAKMALGFNMQVSYFSKTRNQDFEASGLCYRELDELLQDCDIISLHVPRDLMILTANKFSLLKSGSILVNTCIGSVIDLEAFKVWMRNSSNYAIFDHQDYLAEIAGFPNAITPSDHGAWTKESADRLGQKVVSNIDSFFCPG